MPSFENHSKSNTNFDTQNNEFSQGVKTVNKESIKNNAAKITASPLYQKIFTREQAIQIQSPNQHKYFFLPYNHSYNHPLHAKTTDKQQSRKIKRHQQKIHIKKLLHYKQQLYQQSLLQNKQKKLFLNSQKTLQQTRERNLETRFGFESLAL